MDVSLNADYLRGRKVCATGRLVSMTHAELAKLVQTCGGTYLRTPRRGSLTLVVGDRGCLTEDDGSPGNVNGRIFDRARRLRAYGYPIEFLPEEDFLERLGLNQSASAIRGQHTISDLSRILEISTVRLRRWIQSGLIQPVTMQFQIPYFDFHQVAFIKQLHELVEAGASLANIERGIERTKDLLPHGQSLSTLWSSIERDGRVLVRLRDQLIDYTGQRYFDFTANSNADATLFAAQLQSGFHDLCDEALAFEDSGRLEDAAEAYHRALQLKPDHPTLHFDLGNVLFQLGRFDEAIAQFRQALEFDPSFAMAMHNLGSVYAHLRVWDEAEVFLRRALSLVPTYADSHFTLAEVLRIQGRFGEASQHQNAYLEHSQAGRLIASRENLLRIVHAEAEE